MTGTGTVTANGTGGAGAEPGAGGGLLRVSATRTSPSDSDPSAGRARAKAAKKPLQKGSSAAVKEKVSLKEKTPRAKTAARHEMSPEDLRERGLSRAAREQAAADRCALLSCRCSV